MNLGFFISNLTVIAMTLCNVSNTKDGIFDVPHQEEYNWKELAVYTNWYKYHAYEVCVEELKAEGYDEFSSGYSNFELKNPGLPYSSYLFELEDFREYFKNEINSRYKKLNKLKHRAIAYYFSLAIHASKETGMLPIETWCRIHGRGTYYKDDFLKNDTIYRKYLRRIAFNTGLPTKEQILVYRTIDVCIYEIKHTSVHSYFFKLHHNITYHYGYQYFKLEGFSWCVINACYDTLINAGFLDVSAKENIKLVMLPTFKITEKYGYIYEFFQYLKNISKQPTDPSQILNPYDSKEEIQSGYLRNWCTVQVCHEQLVKEGFIYETYTANYFVNPSVEESISKKEDENVSFQELISEKENGNVSFQFVKGYSQFLKAANVEYRLLARNPLEWCKLIITPHKNTPEDAKLIYDPFGILKNL